MGSLNFFNEDNDFKLSNPNVYKDWIFSFIQKYKKTVAEISFIFCSDDYLLNVNKKYLNHDYYTDIITFNYNEGNSVSGDIFISIERVKENASNFETSFNDELLRVLAHGVLHLLGFNDKSEEEQVVMTREENACIERFKMLKNK